MEGSIEGRLLIFKGTYSLSLTIRPLALYREYCHPKSAHTRFVHSRGEFGLCLKRHVLDSGRDLGSLIQLG